SRMWRGWTTGGKKRPGVSCRAPFCGHQGGLDRLEQRGNLERLAKEAVCVMHLCGLQQLMAGGNQEHREVRAHAAAYGFELEPIHPGHANIGDEEIDAR